MAIIGVQFKRNGEFGGKEYDFEIAPNEKIPKVGDIIRMETPEGLKVCNKTRVRVSSIKEISNKVNGGLIRAIPSSMDEPSIAKR